MTYAVIILRRAQKELSALPKDAYGRLRDSIRDLAQAPQPNSSKKLAGRSVPERLKSASRVGPSLAAGHLMPIADPSIL